MERFHLMEGKKGKVFETKAFVGFQHHHIMSFLAWVSEVADWNCYVLMMRFIENFVRLFLTIRARMEKNCIIIPLIIGLGKENKPFFT